MTVSRKDVYNAIDTERDYQDTLARNEVNNPGTPFENLAIIEDIIRQMKEDFYKDPGYPKMDYWRKIAGVSVRTMEQYGAPVRE